MKISKEKMLEARDLALSLNILGVSLRIKLGTGDYGSCLYDLGEFQDSERYFGIMDTPEPYSECYNNPSIIYDSLNDKLIPVLKIEWKKDGIYYTDYYTKKEIRID